MKIVVVYAIFAYVMWLLLVRPMYIAMKYKNETGISVPSGLDRETLMTKLHQSFSFPDLKEVAYNEQGQIVLYCKMGEHPLRLEGTQLYVGKGQEKISSRKKTHYIEEAECIKSYLLKLFYPDAAVNPVKQYKKFKHHRRNSILVFAALWILFAVAAFAGADQAGYVDEVTSSQVSSSYLTDYSTSITIGEAFKNFFADPEWLTYQDGAQKMVDFKGNCLYNDEEATVIITFLVNSDDFVVKDIKVDGESLTPIAYDHFLSAVYGK